MDQSQRAHHPETSSTSPDTTSQTGHANVGDWQEEAYQKVKSMKEMYLPELNETYQKIATKILQHESLPQQPKPENLEKLKIFKTVLERLIAVLQISKSNISPGLKEKLGSYEKQIIYFIMTYKHRKPVSSLQQGQLPPSHMNSMQQSQSQNTEVQYHENQMNRQLQSMNLQGSVGTMQQKNLTSLQQNSVYLSGVLEVQQNMMNSLQSNMDSLQGNSLNSMQQVAVGSLQQNPLSAPQYSTSQAGNANVGDWQEETLSKDPIHLPELNEMYQKIAAKLHRHESLPKQPKPEQLEKLKMFKTMLERLFAFLEISKSNISPGLKEKLGYYEEQIINFINKNRSREPVSSLQQG